MLDKVITHQNRLLPLRSVPLQATGRNNEVRNGRRNGIVAPPFTIENIAVIKPYYGGN